MRVALVQQDPIVGDVQGNLRRILQGIERARKGGADLVLFPELALTGYPLLDLVFRADLLRGQEPALRRIAEATRGIAAIVGFVEPFAEGPGPGGRPRVHNAAAVFHDGRRVAVHRKVLLPEYDVFFENRYFTPGDVATVVEIAGRRVGVQICEDMWDEGYARRVTAEQVAAGAEIVVNVAASPYHVGKGALRRQLARRHVREHARPLIFVNQVGGEDGYEGELVFDGDSFAMDAEGKVIARAGAFEEAVVFADLDADGRGREVDDPEPDPDDEALDALVCGVRCYARRTGFESALIGLSGGIDSSLVAAVAAAALGPSHVLGVALPSRFSSPASREDAEALARNLGIGFETLSIEPGCRALLDTLAPLFRGRPPDVTEENLQARVRGALLMAISNKFGRLLLSTGNKTEIALGYCTLYGDMNGGLMVLGDVSKPRVYALARAHDRRAGREVVPRRVFEKPPSAELREGQVDPFDYDVVGPLVDFLVEEDLTVDQCVERGFERSLVEEIVRLLRRAEYKRRQAAPCIKITPRAFGVGRRYPIA